MKKRFLATLILAVLLAFGTTPAAWAETVDWAVNGGTIQFKYGDKIADVIKSDKTVTAVVIPAKIANVPVYDIAEKAFMDCTVLTNVTLPEGLVEIKKEAFKNCRSLTEINLPGSVKTIGARVFEGCENLKSIAIPQGVSNLYVSLFENCTKLTDVTIPEGVVQIHTEAFKSCRSLENITLPNSVTSIGQSAFQNCSTLKSITIPNKVTIINPSVFENCARLTDVVIPDGVTQISMTAFKNCWGLQEINLPNSITSIGEGAFEGCSGLTGIAIPDGPASIDSFAFLGCSGLTTVYIPTSVTSIMGGAFSDCTALTDVFYAGSKADWDTISIAAGNDYLKNATVHYGVDTTEGECGAQGARVSWKLDADGTLTISGSGAMADYERYGAPWAYKRNEIQTIIIEEGVTRVGGSAFRGSANLTDVTVGSGVISIGSEAFASCSSLTDITIPDSVTTIEGGVFEYCESLTGITIPNSVTVIGVEAFYCCKNLRSVTLSNSLTNIGSHAFDGCSSLTEITIPNSVTSIGAHAFKYCGLTAITIPKDVKIIEDGVFEYCKNLRSVAIPNSVTVIGSHAFASCSSLTEITIPNSVTTIFTGAFEGCGSLATITMSNKIATVGEYAFSSCNKLADVYYDATKEDWNAISIGSGNQPLLNATLHCKDGVVNEKPAGVYVITFDTDGGVLVGGLTSPAYVTKGEAYKMPNASKNGHTLTAWAIGSPNGENRVNANEVYTFTADTTVYAIWQYNSGTGSGGGHSSAAKPNAAEKPGAAENPGATGSSPSVAANITAQNINSKFADVKNNAWYSEAIAYVYNQGIMTGVGSGFEPDAATTRAMLVTMLHRLENEPAADQTNFSDVPSGQWFSNAIAWAAAQGVVNGYEDGKFAPNEAITREQLAVILYRFAQLKGQAADATGSLANFSDGGSVSSWATEAMQWAVGAGIIQGDNGALNPSGNATRAEVAIMIMRFLTQH